MRREQCEGCPNLLNHISAIRQIAVSGIEFPKNWNRVRWYCSDGGVRPLVLRSQCSLANNGKGGVHISGRQ